MGSRLILGTRSGQVGFWVSKPGRLATSTAFDDLLIDTTRINTQPVFKGQVVNPRIYYDSGRSKVVGFPSFGATDYGYATYYMSVITHNLGYIPLCHISIGSANAGDIYPQVYLTTTVLYLMFRDPLYGEWYYYPPGAAPGKGAWYAASEALPADGSYIDFPFTMNYTIFRQRAV